MQDECDKVARAEAGKNVSGFILSESECTKDFLLQELARLRVENADLKDRLGEASDPECMRRKVSYSYMTPDSSKRNTDSVLLYAYSADMAKKFFSNWVAVMSTVIQGSVRWPRYDLKIEYVKECEK